MTISEDYYQSDPNQIVYSQEWQFALMCAAWPFDVPAPATLSTDIPLMWITADFDLKYVFSSSFRCVSYPDTYAALRQS